MRAGRLTERIKLQTKTLNKDAELNTVPSWQDWGSVWAEALPKSGREYFKLQTSNSEITEVFAIRFNSGVTPHMRVVYKAQEYNIISVIVAKRDVEMWLTCKAVV